MSGSTDDRPQSELQAICTEIKELRAMLANPSNANPTRQKLLQGLLNELQQEGRHTKRRQEKRAKCEAIKQRRASEAETPFQSAQQQYEIEKKEHDDREWARVCWHANVMGRDPGPPEPFGKLPPIEIGSDGWSR